MWEAGLRATSNGHTLLAGEIPGQHPMSLHAGGEANVFKKGMEEQVYMLE